MGDLDGKGVEALRKLEGASTLVVYVSEAAYKASKQVHEKRINDTSRTPHPNPARELEGYVRVIGKSLGLKLPYGGSLGVLGVSYVTDLIKINREKKK